MISMQFDWQGLVILAIVSIFAGAGYLMLWDRVDTAMARIGNMYDAARAIKNRPLRLVMMVLAIVAWPIWSFTQMILGAVGFVSAVIYATFIHPIVERISKRKRQ